MAATGHVLQIQRLFSDDKVILQPRSDMGASAPQRVNRVRVKAVPEKGGVVARDLALPAVVRAKVMRCCLRT
jgi:hypothetical protein